MRLTNQAYNVGSLNAIENCHKKVSAANFKIPKRKARAQYTFVRMFAKLELRLKNAFMDKVFFLLLKQPMDQFD